MGFDASVFVPSAVADAYSRYSSALRRLVILACSIIALGILGYLLFATFGFVGGVVYGTAFVVGATLLPGIVMFVQSGTPLTIGKLEFAFGQMAFGRGWLVQRNDGWDMHPGEVIDGVDHVWIDGQWRPVPDTANQTILGYQPFGVLFYKDDDTLEEVRVDDELRSSLDHGDTPSAGEIARMRASDVLSTEPERASVTDGSGTKLERSGVRQKQPTVEDLPESGWLVDLARYWTPGLEKMADIDILEKVEEVTMRSEALGETDSKRMMYGTVVGLVLGAATGYVVMAV